MSALLTKFVGEKINFECEYGLSQRSFNPTPCFRVSDQYQKVFMAVHVSPQVSGNRVENYKNHFSLYVGDDRIVLVRIEGNLKFPDADCVLEYYTITPLSGSKGNIGNWSVSLDDVEFSHSKPETFDGLTFTAHGEWWFFDQGIVLNGQTSYFKNSIVYSFFSYLELFDIREKLPTQPSATSAFSALTSFTSLFPQRQPLPNVSFGPATAAPSPLLANTRQTARFQNDITHPNDTPSQAVVPSLFWFESRSRELNNADLSYFIEKINFNQKSINSFRQDRCLDLLGSIFL